MKHEELQLYIRKTDNEAYIVAVPIKEPGVANLFKKIEYEKYAFKTYEELQNWLEKKLEKI